MRYSEALQMIGGIESGKLKSESNEMWNWERVFSA